MTENKSAPRSRHNQHVPTQLIIRVCWNLDFELFMLDCFVGLVGVVLEWLVVGVVDWFMDWCVVGFVDWFVDCASDARHWQRAGG